MVRITTRRDPDGLILHAGPINCGSGLPEHGVHMMLFLDRVECEMVLESILEAKERYWSKLEEK